MINGMKMDLMEIGNMIDLHPNVAGVLATG